MNCARKLTLLVCTFLAALSLSLATPVSVANAQLTPSVPGVDLGTELEPFLDKAKEKGLGVIIVTPLESAEEAETPATDWQQDGLKLRQEIRNILQHAPQVPHAVVTAIREASPDGTDWWLAWALGITGLCILAMNGTRLLVARINQHFLKTMLTEDPQNRADKIGFLLFRAGLIFGNIVFNFGVAMIVAIILDYGHEPSRATIFILVVAFSSYWIFRAAILFNIIAHDLPKHRMINLNDEDAKMIQYSWRNSMVAVIIFFSITAWFDALNIDREIYKLMLLVSMTLTVLTFGYLTYRHRVPFVGVLLGAGEPATKPAWRRAFANSWHWITFAYLAVAWVISVYRTVLDLPSATILVAAPVIAFLGGVGAYGVVLLIIDKTYQARQRRFDVKVALAREKEKIRRELEQVAIEAALREAPEDDEELIINKVMAERKMEEMPAFRPVFKPLLEQAAGILITIVAVGFVLGTWDVNIGEQGNPITAFLDTLMIGFVGWFLYRAVAAYIDDQIAEEGDDTPEGAPDGEMGGQGASRLTTLLPLIRNVMIAGIVVLTAMVILSNMGVDIAPLFAGAGVIGLAIGFGAQTLIRDIFSGGFFLFDDAFRRGEYIELDGIVGTVEKISLRSFQLRHHNGPLHTVPFGEIKQLTNFSRDWVMMKLPLRLTYDTDVERVRKLVKKLGQRLLEHPDVGHLFLQPLKSQGVYKMEDSAMIVRVKFMTKPGDQFVTRKVVYQHIRELFEQEGIKFAHKEVTVRLADEPQRPLTPKEEKAVAAAARASVDADMDDLESVASDDGP
ncbi:MAG: mechanosensitive ion channel family protein [Rhizobiaceae bacterium]